MKTKVLLLFLLVFSSLSSQEPLPNKIVYLVSPPRSLSVAFTRMMQARGDFEIFHEPSIYAYDLIHYPEFAASTFKEGSFSTFDDVKHALFEAARKRPVFAKEMSFSVADYILQDPEFLMNDQVYFVFLVRNPHHCTISFYNRQLNANSDLCNLIAFEPLYRLYKEVKLKAKHPPILIFSEDLYTDPEKIVSLFCQKVGIPVLPHALSWNNLGDSFDGYAEWHELKKSPKLVHYWHGNAIQSKGFTQPTSYEVDQNGEPTFSEILDPEHARWCKEAWLYNKPFYEKLKEEALRDR